MRQLLALKISISVCGFLACVDPALAQMTPAPRSPAGSYGKLPLSFELNQGQTDASVHYLAHGEGYTLFLRQGEAVLALRKSFSKSDPAKVGSTKSAAGQASLISMRLIGADPKAAVSSEDRQITRTNYLMGNDPTRWRTGIPNYGRVRYRSVYEGIDLVYYGNQSRLEHDFVIAPNANPGRIALSIEGARRLSVDPASGDLLLNSAAGEVRLLKPVSYQESDGKRVEIASAYKLLDHHRISFSLGAYDRTRPLIIDPILVYSTLVKSYYADVNALAVDGSGNAYVTGDTAAFAFPVTAHAFQTIDHNTGEGFGGTTPYVAEINPTGTALIYATFLGGSGMDSPHGIAVDSSGDVYITGSAGSGDFPVTTGAFQTTHKGSTNAFVTKLNSTGSALVYSTFLGGSGGGGDQYSYVNGDSGNAIAVDSAGNAFVTGNTQSTDFPVTSGAFQTAYKGIAISPRTPNAFIAKLNSTGTGLIYSTFLGGTGHAGYFYTKLGDSANAIAIDSSGSAFVAGITYSNDFPTTPEAFQTVQKGVQTADSRATSNAFVTKLSADGTALAYSTYLGGTTAAGQYAIFGDVAYAIAVDSAGEAHVAGHASSPDFPVTSSAYQTSAKGNHPAFVTVLNATGTACVYSTFLGGYGYDSANAIALDSSGNTYVAGSTSGFGYTATFPVTASAFESTLLGYSAPAFVTELDPSGSNLVYSTLINGVGTNSVTGIAVSDPSHVYIAGSTTSTDFPTSPGALGASIADYEGLAGFVAELDIPSALGEANTVTTLQATPNPQYGGLPIQLTAKVRIPGVHAVPQGTVDFRVDGQVAGTVPLSATGMATLSVPSPGNFQNTVAADYSGSAIFNPSSVILPVKVNFVGITSISGGGQNAFYGQNFAAPLVVEVDSGSTPIAGETVSFSGTGVTFSATSVVTGADGRASVTAKANMVGSLSASAAVDAAGSHLTANFSLLGRKSLLHFQPAPVSLNYGSAIPPLTNFSVTGLVNGDTTNSAYTGAPILSTTATATSPAGQYAITLSQGTLASSNYSFGFLAGSLQILRAKLTIRPTSFTIHVGDPLPNFTYTITGFVNGQTQATATTGVPALSTTATSTAKAGRFYIIGAVGTLKAQNYTFVAPTTATDGVLTILE